MPMTFQEIEILTDVSVEPLSLAAVKQALRVDFADEDSFIASLITNARTYGEDITNKVFAPKTLRVTLQPLPVPAGALSGPVDGPYDFWQMQERPDIPLFGYAQIRLPLPGNPVQSVSLIEYQLTRMDIPEWTTLAATDGNGNATYRVDTAAVPAEVSIFTVLAASRYRITYTSGYATLPGTLQQAMLNLINFWYNNREGQPVPATIDAQFAKRRTWSL